MIFAWITTYTRHCLDQDYHHRQTRVAHELTVNIFESGSQCEKNFGVDLSISVLGTWKCSLMSTKQFSTTTKEKNTQPKSNIQQKYESTLKAIISYGSAANRRYWYLLSKGCTLCKRKNGNIKLLTTIWEKALNKITRIDLFVGGHKPVSRLGKVFDLGIFNLRHQIIKNTHNIVNLSDNVQKKKKQSELCINIKKKNLEQERSLLGLRIILLGHTVPRASNLNCKKGTRNVCWI